MKDGIFDDVLALKQPSAMWPRPSPVGAPNARGNLLRQRRLKCAPSWPCCTAERDSSLHAACKIISALTWLPSGWPVGDMVSMCMLCCHCRESLLGKGIAPVLKARSAETWVEWALPGDQLLEMSCHAEP